MKRLKIHGNRWCEIEIELRPTDKGGPELAITTTTGRVVARAAAKREAREYWKSFLEESPGDLVRLQKDYGVRTAAGAARKILEIDGAFHGIDVHGSTENARIRIAESIGRDSEALAEFFPEALPWLPYHLNGMRAGCEHQRAGGWRNCPGYHKPGEECAAPSLEFPDVRIYSHREYTTDKDARKVPAHRWLAVPKIGDTTNISGEVRQYCPHCSKGPARHADEASPVLPYREARAQMQWPAYRTADRCRHDALSVPCPVCGYAYGSAWLYEPIPAELLASINAWLSAAQ